MTPKKIPPNLEPEVWRLYGEGQGSEEIAAWLWREHKIECGSRCVRQLIARRRTELADVAKSVVREELRRYLIPALKRAARSGQHAEVLERRARLRAAQLRHPATGHPQHPMALNEDHFALKAIDRQLKAANLLLHYAGLNQPDQVLAKAPGAGDARQALLKRVQDLVDKVGAGEVGAPDLGTEPPVH